MSVSAHTRSSSKQPTRVGPPPKEIGTKRQRTTSQIAKTAIPSTPEASKVRGHLRQRPRLTHTDTRRHNKSRIPAKTNQIISVSNIVKQLRENQRHPFSIIPESLEFIHSSHETLGYPIKDLQVPIADIYQSSIEENGYDSSIVCVATISENIGMGVFAARNIQEGEFIGIYSGLQSIGSPDDTNSNRYVYEILTYKSEGGDCAATSIHSTSRKQTKRTLQTDAETHGNFTCLFNDGRKKANVISKLRKINGHIEIAMFAKIYIPQGHQLLIDYGSRYWKNLDLSYHKLTPSTYILECSQQVEAAAPSSSSSSQAQETLMAYWRRENENTFSAEELNRRFLRDIFSDSVAPY